MPTASWNQLERTIEQLHGAARSTVGVREFYRQLVTDAVAALDAASGAAWRVGAGGRPEPIVQALPDGTRHDQGLEADWSARLARIEHCLAGGSATITSLDAEYDVLVCAVEHPAAGAETGIALPHTAVIELWMPRGASPPVRQGWLDFAAALADVATDFHARDELRRLRGATALSHQAVDVLRRASSADSLAGAAFEVANEGRRALPCDRLTVLVRQGRRWRLAAVSGVDLPAARTDFARRGEKLAVQVAGWGEPIEQGVASSGSDAELPPRLAEALDQYIDHSHARTAACVPIKLAPPTSGPASADAAETAGKFDIVLIAERFDAGAPLRDALVELGELCAPAIARARQLDRFPIRTALRWSERLGRLREPARLAKVLLTLAALTSIPVALLLIPATLTIEAPAHMTAAIERDVFATASGAVAEVRVEHGQMVEAGEVLLVLADPELAVQLQATRGEIDATRKRLDALAMTRIDRDRSDQSADDRLPLAAEQRELEERLASLDRERTLLEAQSAALTLRSPRAGQVITRDVQRLLESRPVERGQALLTIADLSTGWELRADVPQRQIGDLLAAEQGNATDKPIEVSYRLAGDVEQQYPGHVLAVSSAAPIDADGLRDEAAPVEVRIAIDGEPPAAARPGMTATVRIDCGQRSLGYVWLHDVVGTVYRWLTF